MPVLVPHRATAPLRRPATDASAWQRLLQEAEQGRWFLGASPVPSVRPDGAPLSAPPAFVQRSADARVLATGFDGGQYHPAIAASGAEAEAAGAAAPPYGSRIARPYPPMPLPLAQPSAEPAGSDPATECTSVAQARATRAPQPPFRLHVEATQSGVVVWFGIDGSVEGVAARAAVLLDEIRRQSTQAGVRLSAVICNGALAYEASTHEEKP
jgi:hypothetical protein